ncbi:hypothetical protein PVAND_005559 [Polypedilum vanderplanki]|uniref:PAT complex subunit CCDC47 n=1 Tax=Polypedilum vanderplanki TaxID=319348 RepID=A0A9J6C0D0_POLVA|nr:hypothetical protein PVAND_005559 [Polypedilum vanderplanki]
MKITLILLLLATTAFTFEDDEFADFEDFEVETENEVNEIPQKKIAEGEKPIIKEQATTTDSDTDSFNNDDDEGIVEDEFDQDEFEGFAGEIEDDRNEGKKKGAEPKLKIVNKVPYSKVLWYNYYIEMLFLGGLVLYFTNYAVGKNKNISIANAWLQTHKQFLEENFALVGDEANANNDPAYFMKDSDSIYSLWCSGRTLVEGMLVELKLIKRQDLLSITLGLLKKVSDQVQIKVELSKDSMDTFVFAVCSKSAARVLKDMTDLKQYCINVAKADEKYSLPSGFCVLSEISESTAAMLDSKVSSILSKYSQNIESIHISDQYSGLNNMQEQDQTLAKPETKKMLILTYNFSEKTDLNDLKTIMQLVIYLVEKLKRYKLSREGKMKADKNRQRVEEEYLKNTHQSRMEAAALKKEEKRKQEKEKMMNEENVDKQIKLEKKMKRKDAKKAMPKMKSMNIHL